LDWLVTIVATLQQMRRDPNEQMRRDPNEQRDPNAFDL